jgi:hypothetical protein
VTDDKSVLSFPTDVAPSDVFQRHLGTALP